MRTGFKARRLTAILSVASAVLAGLPIAAGATTGTAADGPTVVPIQVTGPASSRFNLVVMGDGYTAAELPWVSGAAATRTACNGC